MPYEKPRKHLNECIQKPLGRRSHKKEGGQHDISISIIDVIQDIQIQVTIFIASEESGRRMEVIVKKNQ